MRGRWGSRGVRRQRGVRRVRPLDRSDDRNDLRKPTPYMFAALLYKRDKLFAFIFVSSRNLLDRISTEAADTQGDPDN